MIWDGQILLSLCIWFHLEKKKLAWLIRFEVQYLWLDFQCTKDEEKKMNRKKISADDTTRASNFIFRFSNRNTVWKYLVWFNVILTWMMNQPMNLVPKYSPNLMIPMLGFAVATIECSCKIVAVLLVAVMQDRMNASGTNMERIVAGHRRPYYDLLAPYHLSWYAAAAAAVPDHNNGNRFDC